MYVVPQVCCMGPSVVYRVLAFFPKDEVQVSLSSRPAPYLPPHLHTQIIITASLIVTYMEELA